MKPTIKKFFNKVTTVGLAFQWFGINNPWSSSFTTFNGTVSKAQTVINLAAGASGLVAVGIIIAGGYTFITASGNPESIDKGSKMVMYAVAGLIVVFISRALIIFVLSDILGV
ncbi:hypothetical protein KC622_00770 [Candidatus Dojkabacteria bacterium]|uniref:Uncharacterized protein n=1 Tax=Candidatus Dojkabacteria bacterium TaxID=2099670 RepID=A0A955I1I5_9BACT|nr:hypothetical protein [Candidatus Dojkabacteria bacterium]MCB9790981.1 hypothetical protein [Candidatus Nomurabacteria bacterium]